MLPQLGGPDFVVNRLENFSERKERWRTASLPFVENLKDLKEVPVYLEGRTLLKKVFFTRVLDENLDCCKEFLRCQVLIKIVGSQEIIEVVATDVE